MLRAWRMSALAATAGLLAFPGAALADHGRAGLWDIKVSVAMQGMNFPQTVSSKHCMTPQEVASTGLLAMPQTGCTMKNTGGSGDTLTGDMVCTSGMTGTGHMTITYDHPDHYTGNMTFAGAAQDGTPVNFTQSMEGHWIAESCGNVTK